MIFDIFSVLFRETRIERKEDRMIAESLGWNEKNLRVWN